MRANKHMNGWQDSQLSAVYLSLSLLSASSCWEWQRQKGCNDNDIKNAEKIIFSHYVVNSANCSYEDNLNLRDVALMRHSNQQAKYPTTSEPPEE